MCSLSLWSPPDLPARADKCTGAKLKAVGKKESGLLSCQSKVAATNDTSGLSACETKVKGKFSTVFGKAGTCVGDEMTCENKADDCEASVASAMTDAFPSRCEASKRKAAGKLASGELGCYSKAAAKGVPLDSGCITKTQGKFTGALTKAGACPDGGSPQSLVENNCVQPAVTIDGGGTVTDVCPTTSTTTTTTSTTSTTTSTTTTPTTTSTSTTSITFPSCSTAGATCGTCGHGVCFPLCGHGCALACIDTSAGSGGACFADDGCNAGELCAANRPPSGQCPGDCGGAPGSACQMPCPTFHWVSTGSIGDCSGLDRAPLTPTDVPDPSQCTQASQGTAAVCWDGVNYSNGCCPGQAECTYKSVAPADCTGGVNPGYMYVCEP